MKDYAPKTYHLPARNGASRIITESFAAGLSVAAFVASPTRLRTGEELPEVAQELHRVGNHLNQSIHSRVDAQHNYATLGRFLRSG